MNKLKYYVVSLEGVDKAGKSSLIPYLARMSNYTLNILDRGPITNIVWNKIQNRDATYDMEMWKNTLFVKLNVDINDWKIRCSIHNEPPMPLSFDQMNAEYDQVFSRLKSEGFKTTSFDTSTTTIHQIAIAIINKLDELNKS